MLLPLVDRALPTEDAHRDQDWFPVYELVVAKGGPKLQAVGTIKRSSR